MTQQGGVPMDKVVYQLSVKLTERQRDLLFEICEKEDRLKLRAKIIKSVFLSIIFNY